MQIYGLNRNGKRIPASRAAADEEYVCPYCGRPLLYVKKSKRACEHFRHKGGETCFEYKKYEEKRKQPAVSDKRWTEEAVSRFPEEERSVITSGGHTADVLTKDLAVFFEDASSPSSPEILKKRVEAAVAAGYKACIVLDVESEIKEGKFFVSSEKTKGYIVLSWNSPAKCLEWYSYNNSDLKKDVAVCFHLGKAENGFTEINEKAEWTPDGMLAWRKICTGISESVRIDKGLCADDVFLSPAQRAWKYVQKKKDLKHLYELYSGEKGMGSKKVYQCPITEDWLDVNGKCRKCIHCAAILYYSKKNPEYDSYSKCNKVYCAWPDLPSVVRKCRTFGRY